jgi:hypothetical protein
MIIVVVVGVQEFQNEARIIVVVVVESGFACIAVAVAIATPIHRSGGGEFPHTPPRSLPQELDVVLLMSRCFRRVVVAFRRDRTERFRNVQLVKHVARRLDNP